MYKIEIANNVDSFIKNHCNAPAINDINITLHKTHYIVFL